MTDLNGKANSSHTHSTNDITSGTLPLSRGGTGVTTISALKSALGISSSGSELKIEIHLGAPGSTTFNIKPMVVIAIGTQRGQYGDGSVIAVAIRGYNGEIENSTRGYCAISVAWDGYCDCSTVSFSNNSISEFTTKNGMLSWYYNTHVVFGY